MGGIIMLPGWPSSTMSTGKRIISPASKEDLPNAIRTEFDIPASSRLKCQRWDSTFDDWVDIHEDEYDELEDPTRLQVEVETSVPVVIPTGINVTGFEQPVVTEPVACTSSKGTEE